MKNKFKILFVVVGVLLIGCSDDNNDSTNPLGTTPVGGGGDVTFQVSIQQDQQGDWYFVFKPNVSIKLIKIDGTVNNQTETVNGDGNTVYTTAEGFSIGPVDIATGESWGFVITGKIANDNSDFTSSVNYTIPNNTGGGTNDVTFQVSAQQGQQGGTVFFLTPSVDIRIDKLDVTQNNQSTTITGDGTTIFTNTNGLTVGEYTTTTGDQFTFVFTGKIAASNNNFTSTVSFTVP